jgi:rfaE bifunctional protein kinase chain/domain
MDRPAAEHILSRAGALRIMVLGDFMLDQFIWGSVDRISPEAPVPVVNVQRENSILGGAGNVVMNLQALGANVLPLGATGDDAAGDRIRTLLSENGLPQDGLMKSDRPTTVKTRIIAHQQQVVRVDREERSFIEDSLQAALADRVVSALSSIDAILVSDYSKGTVTPALLERILPAAQKANRIVCVDPKPRYFTSYSPVTIITPNQAEAGMVLGRTIQTEEDLREAGARILERINCRGLLITRGDRGMALFSRNGIAMVPARAREVYDVTGAGDTVVSVLCLALAAGADMRPAVQLANAAAGIVVGKVGTATVSPAELLSQL